MPSDGGISIVTLGRESQSWKVSPSRVFGSISLFPAKTPLCAMLYSAKSLQSCPALCDPMDYSPQGSSVHGILQAWILEGVALPYSGAEMEVGRAYPFLILLITSFAVWSSYSMGFPGGTSGKEPTCQCRLDVRHTGLIPGSGRSWRRIW